MPPKRVPATRSHDTRVSVRAASHEVVAENTHVVVNQGEVGQPAAQPVDLEAVTQIAQEAARQAAQDAVQQVAQEAARVAAQEAVRVAAHEAARVAAQEVARQVGLQAEQVAAQPAQQAAGQPEQVDDHAALMEELLRYRERFGGQLHGEDAAGRAGHSGIRVGFGSGLIGFGFFGYRNIRPI